MPNYESSITNKKFAAPDMRELEIPDASGYHVPQNLMNNDENLAETERHFQEARRAKITGKERLSEGAKKRINMLIGVSRTTRNVELDGNIWELQSLKGKEIQDSLMSSAQYDGTVQFSYEMRKQLLSRSISSIGGVDINTFLSSNDFNDKLNLIDELDDSLLMRLYDEYVLMSKDSRDKYAIKNEADAKELVEDLKK
jgi:hypothetical protein